MAFNQSESAQETRIATSSIASSSPKVGFGRNSELFPVGFERLFFLAPSFVIVIRRDSFSVLHDYPTQFYCSIVVLAVHGILLFASRSNIANFQK